MRFALCLLFAANGCGHSGQDCGAVLCGPLPPALRLNVRNARGGSLGGVVALSNVVTPAGPSSAPDACVAETSALTTCSINKGAGHYELDVSAPGYVGQHVSANVPAPITAPGACCGVPYVPVQVEVLLTAVP